MLRLGLVGSKVHLGAFLRKTEYTSTPRGQSRMPRWILVCQKAYTPDKVLEVLFDLTRKFPFNVKATAIEEVLLKSWTQACRRMQLLMPEPNTTQEESHLLAIAEANYMCEAVTGTVCLSLGSTAPGCWA